MSEQLPEYTERFEIVSGLVYDSKNDSYFSIQQTCEALNELNDEIKLSSHAPATPSDAQISDINLVLLVKHLEEILGHMENGDDEAAEIGLEHIVGELKLVHFPGQSVATTPSTDAVTELRKLADKWDEEKHTYGYYTHAGYETCARELRSALARLAPPERDDAPKDKSK